MDKDFPACGILGKIVEYSPDVRFIATGKTFEVIKKAGLNVIGISEYTGFPEMKSGMVKTLHPLIHGGILGNEYTESDQKYMSDFNILPIDAIIINFYGLREALEKGESLEIIRQMIDIGGPTLCHAARKAFINTALIANSSEYKKMIENIAENCGCCTMEYRLDAAKRGSKELTKLMLLIDNFFQEINLMEVAEEYNILSSIYESE